jgi:predicted NAD/FAD-dependent oxidoreductase
MSNVSAGYAPTGASTVVVSSPGVGGDLRAAMTKQLSEWFGPAVGNWDVLRVDEIEQAQPAQPVGRPRTETTRTDDGVWICGDHLVDASINGALGSGRAAGRSIAALAANDAGTT